MKKWGVIFLCVLAFLSCTAKPREGGHADKGAGSGASEMPAPDEAAVINEKLELKAYERIVILSGGAVETIYMLGGEERIAAIGSSREGIWPREKTASLATVGNLARPNMEAIMARNPDLVILNGMIAGLAEQFTQRDIAVYLHKADSIEEILESLTTLGILTGREEEAARLREEKQGALAELKLRREALPPTLKGAILYAAGPIMGFTEASLPGEILDLLGVENIAAGLDAARPILSSEYILKENPDFLFCAMAIAKEEDLLEANPFLTKTTAGREGNVAILPSSLFLRPSPRLFDQLPRLVEILEGL